MKKTKRFILLSACLALWSFSACGTQPEQPAETIAYRFADREEGVSLLTADMDYYEGLSANELEYRMQKKDASPEEYLDFAKQQAMEFSDEYKAALDRLMAEINARIQQEQYHLPPADEISLVLTSMKEEPGAEAYTKGSSIFMGMYVPALAGAEDPSAREHAFEIMCHELFHVLSRNHPDFRKAMYEIIHFKIADEEFELPPSVSEYYYSNPDVERHDAYAAFETGGETRDCFLAMVTGRHWEKPVDSGMNMIKPVLVQVDGADEFHETWQAENFDEIFGANTGYTYDPEEVMAVNFAFALTYGMNGPGGNGYASPEIIEKIVQYLKGE